jgi:hypothetical protein
MSTFTAKILAQGQLPNAKGTLYTVPALNKTYVKFINAFNPSAGVETIFFYVKKLSGSSRIIGTGTLDINEQHRVIEKDETLNLGAGDIIEGQTTTAAKVDYTITGVEEAP